MSESLDGERHDLALRVNCPFPDTLLADRETSRVYLGGLSRLYRRLRGGIFSAHEGVHREPRVARVDRVDWTHHRVISPMNYDHRYRAGPRAHRVQCASRERARVRRAIRHRANA